MQKYKYRIFALFIIAMTFGISFYLYAGGKEQDALGFKLGLDLSGGTHLLYKADVSRLNEADIKDSLAALRDTIERRVNIFGVSEPIVQLEEGSALDSKARHRLIVELPGVSDTQKAVEALGKTPVLEFRMQIPADEKSVAKKKNDGELELDLKPAYGPALLTGAHLKQATLQFGDGSGASLSNEPVVVLRFNDEGKEIFAKLTKENVGKVFGIFLDGVPISTPVIREAIPGGVAVISGNFTPQEAKELVRNLNFGALPVPIELLSSQSIGASLGHDALSKAVLAALWGFASLLIFMTLWYRLPGVASGLALLFYILFMLLLFKALPVTLTAAGLAGFILSIGMALDANVLIFERIKEELKDGKALLAAIEGGFSRAWTSIRDGNLSSLITAIILFWFGTSMVKGFALVFALGVTVSMLSAIYVSKTLLLALAEFAPESKRMRRLFMSGFNFKKLWK